MTPPTNPTPTDPPASPPSDPHPDLAAARAELATLKQSLEAAERRRALDRALLEAGAIDLDAAALIATATDPERANPAQLAADLERRKPFLFSQARPPSASSAPITNSPAPVDDAATHARSTGDRRSLLHYLRLRRQSQS